MVLRQAILVDDTCTVLHHTWFGPAMDMHSRILPAQGIMLLSRSKSMRPRVTAYQYHFDRRGIIFRHAELPPIVTK